MGNLGARSGPWRLILGAALLVALALAAIEIASYTFAVRRMQVRAERGAVEFAGDTAQGMRSYVRRVVRLPPGATDHHDQGSVAVEAAEDWVSPVFGIRRTIVTQATVGLLPAGSGSEPRFVVLR